jgi:hypothetical protein
MPHQVHRENGSNYERIFGQKPRNASPTREGDHPELDCSELLNHEDTKIYQSLIGALQWVVQLGRIDHYSSDDNVKIRTRQGHMDRVKRIHGFINKMKHAIVRICTEEPDHSDIQKSSTTGRTHVTGEPRKPDDAPPPLGKRVVFTAFVDANLYHDLISGSRSQVIHCANQTIIDFSIAVYR